MMTKSMPKFFELPFKLDRDKVIQRIQLAPWQVVALASFCASVGGGWRALADPLELTSPPVVMAAMMLMTFVGWYAWGFFTHLTDQVLFGGHSDYQGTLDAFGYAYAFQALVLFSFTRPLGSLWSWIAFYLTVVAWGFFGPRRLGMRTWQAIVAVMLGMLLWLACLWILVFTLTWDGIYVGVGIYLI